MIKTVLTVGADGAQTYTQVECADDPAIEPVAEPTVSERISTLESELSELKSLVATSETEAI